MSFDGRSIGIILLVVGIILLIGGIFVGMSSTGLATNQQNGAYNAFASGALRLYAGVGIGVIGVVFIIFGAYLLFRE